MINPSLINHPDVADTLGSIYHKKGAYIKASTLLELPDNAVTATTWA